MGTGVRPGREGSELWRGLVGGVLGRGSVLGRESSSLAGRGWL